MEDKRIYGKNLETKLLESVDRTLFLTKTQRKYLADIVVIYDIQDTVFSPKSMPSLAYLMSTLEAISTP